MQKALPSSPSKKRKCLEHLPIKNQSSQTGPSAQVLREEEIYRLIELLICGDISYITPGSKDYVYRGVIDGVK